MSWSEVSINVAREHAALAQLVLEQQDALAVTMQDAADNPVLEPGPGATPLWPTVEIRGLFPAKVSRSRIMQALMLVDSIERPEQVRWHVLEDRVWERVWMDRFKPMCFGERLWIVPSGMEIPHDPRNIELKLDPGLAFGTGTHPTTALCLQWLDGQTLEDRLVVDYGCGSGVLGIAAALKGAARVVCVDNDPQALEATRQNADRNGVSDRVVCLTPGEYEEENAGLLLANILSGPLIGLAPVLSGSLAPDAYIVLSGILQDQAAEVIDAYRHCCGDMQIETLEGWVRLVGRPVGT